LNKVVKIVSYSVIAPKVGGEKYEDSLFVILSVARNPVLLYVWSFFGFFTAFRM